MLRLHAAGPRYRFMRQCGKPFSSAHQHKVRQREKMKILLIEDSKLLRVANERVLVKASMKTGVPVHRYFAAMRTGFYSCSRHIRYVRTPPLPLSVALEEHG
jgi:hypothetical protein